MSSTSQAMFNQAILLEDQDISAHLGCNYSFPPSSCCGLISLPFACNNSNNNNTHNHHQLPPLKAFNNPMPPSLLSPPSDAPPAAAFSVDSSAAPKLKEDIFCNLGGGVPKLISLQRSNANLWPWGEVNECMYSTKKSCSGNDHHLGVSAIKMKKVKARRKVREPRFCFKTMSDVDVLDDGYKWRKYGQKVVKDTQHPRSYYRCTQDNCRVKKRVERLAEDPRMVITTYEGRHAHSPSHEDQDDAHHSSSNLCNFFW